MCENCNFQTETFLHYWAFLHMHVRSYKEVVLICSNLPCPCCVWLLLPHAESCSMWPEAIGEVLFGSRIETQDDT